MDHFTRYVRMQLILLHVRLRHNIQLVQQQSVDSGPLTVCTSVCLVVVQENSNRRQLQTVLNACTERFERSPRDSCNLIGSTRFRVGWCKTWTLDSGLDRGLDSGLHFGLHFGPDIGLDFVRMAQKACRRSLYLCLSGCLWELKWGRRGVATLRSAGGGWGSIRQDYFCWGKYQESQILVVFGRIEHVPSIVIQFAV